MPYNIRAVQNAVHTVLAANAGVQALLGSPVRLFDHAPPATAYPFVRYGDQRAEAARTREPSELAIAFTLETYSRYRGRTELRQIEEAIVTALHNTTITVDDGTVAHCQFLQSDQDIEPDGLTYRGALRFRIVTYI
jgi:hypothetical protein